MEKVQTLSFNLSNLTPMISESKRKPVRLKESPEKSKGKR